MRKLKVKEVKDFSNDHGVGTRFKLRKLDHVLLFEKGPHGVAQAGLELTYIDQTGFRLKILLPSSARGGCAHKR